MSKFRGFHKTKPKMIHSNLKGERRAMISGESPIMGILMTNIVRKENSEDGPSTMQRMPRKKAGMP